MKKKEKELVKEKLGFPVCSCSFKQTRENQNGFMVFEKGQEYDIDAIKFHSNEKQDHDIREALRKTYFKKTAIKINKSEKTGGNSNDSNT